MAIGLPCTFAYIAVVVVVAVCVYGVFCTLGRACYRAQNVALFESVEFMPPPQFLGN